ncbi:MAG: OadG family protein [Clostridiales bacterium]|nr:OadG family protein [Clostridiales bacterium]
MSPYMSFLVSASTKTVEMNPTFVGAVVITGFAVVFAGLLLLIAFVSALGKFFTYRENIKNRNLELKTEPKAELKEVVVTQTPVLASPSPIIEEGIDDEVVAVIMASIATMSAKTGKKLALKSISNSVPQRNAWAVAGLQDNTRPF